MVRIFAGTVRAQVMRASVITNIMIQYSSYSFSFGHLEIHLEMILGMIRGYTYASTCAYIHI